MNWKLNHSNVYVDDTGEVKSRSTVLLRFADSAFIVTDTVEKENHVLGSKKVLVDAANKLKKLAREMERKADNIK